MFVNARAQRVYDLIYQFRRSGGLAVDEVDIGNFMEVVFKVMVNVNESFFGPREFSYTLGKTRSFDIAAINGANDIIIRHDKISGNSIDLRQKIKNRRHRIAADQTNFFAPLPKNVGQRQRRGNAVAIRRFVKNNEDARSLAEPSCYSFEHGRRIKWRLFSPTTGTTFQLSTVWCQ